MYQGYDSIYLKSLGEILNNGLKGLLHKLKANKDLKAFDAVLKNLVKIYPFLTKEIPYKHFPIIIKPFEENFFGFLKLKFTQKVTLLNEAYEDKLAEKFTVIIYDLLTNELEE